MMTHEKIMKMKDFRTRAHCNCKKSTLAETREALEVNNWDTEKAVHWYRERNDKLAEANTALTASQTRVRELEGVARSKKGPEKRTTHYQLWREHHMNNKDLLERMLARADRDGLPSDHPMRVAATEFTDACNDYFTAGEPILISVCEFLGHYARARRTWCEYVGEPLVG